jgi:hypothetical protein
MTVPELAAESLGSFLASYMKRRFGSTHTRLTELIPSVARLALECIGNSDALYHDVEHTMLVTLAGHEIMKGRALLAPSLPDDYAHLITDGGFAAAGDDHPVFRAVVMKLQGQPVAGMHLDTLRDEGGADVDDAPSAPGAIFLIADIITNRILAFGRGVHDSAPLGADAGSPGPARWCHAGLKSAGRSKP